MNSNDRIQLVADIFTKRSEVLWSELLAKSSEVVLFGSWAAGMEKRRSDIDLLAVDFGRRIKRPGIDVLAYSREYLETETWVTSELANHIAEFGIWIKGSGEWRSQVKITEETLNRKREQIVIRAARLKYGLRDRSELREGEVLKLRRDLQRLISLIGKHPTPVSAKLDQEWIEMPQADQHCREIFNRTIVDFANYPSELYNGIFGPLRGDGKTTPFCG